MKKRIFVVTGHCDSYEKEFLTLTLLEEIKIKYPNDDIIYGSHLTISEKLQENVDYLFQVKENPIENRDIITDLTSNFGYNFYDIPTKGKIIRFLIPNHGYAHHMLISGTLRCLVHDYEYYHFCNYDINPDLFFRDIDHREKICEDYDGFFYNFNFIKKWVNTEYFTIKKNIVDEISKIRSYSEYTGCLSLEERYTQILTKKFNIHRENHEITDHNFGKIDFKFSSTKHVRPLNPHFPEFGIVAIRHDNLIKIVILHRKDNNLDIVFHLPKKDERIKIRNSKHGWNMVSTKEPCIVSLYKDEKIYFKFDLNDEHNFGKFI